jgi:hypothetical protein
MLFISELVFSLGERREEFRMPPYLYLPHFHSSMIFIAEILLKLSLSTNQSTNQIISMKFGRNTDLVYFLLISFPNMIKGDHSHY